MGVKANTNIPIQAKADAYDLLCKAYEEGSRMDWTLFGRRRSGYNSISEYVGYAFSQLAIRNGSLASDEAKQLEL